MNQSQKRRVEPTQIYYISEEKYEVPALLKQGNIEIRHKRITPIPRKAPEMVPMPRRSSIAEGMQENNRLRRSRPGMDKIHDNALSSDPRSISDQKEADESETT